MKQVLYFSAEWCGPCKMIKPILIKLQSQMTITFIDADASAETCAKWNVRNVPTLLVVKVLTVNIVSLLTLLEIVIGIRINLILHLLNEVSSKQ